MIRRIHHYYGFCCPAQRSRGLVHYLPYYTQVGQLLAVTARATTNTHQFAHPGDEGAFEEADEAEIVDILEAAREIADPVIRLIHLVEQLTVEQLTRRAVTEPSQWVSVGHRDFHDDFLEHACVEAPVGRSEEELCQRETSRGKRLTVLADWVPSGRHLQHRK